MSHRKPIEYALYQDDEFIMIGTLEEIAEHQHVSEATIRFYSSPTYRKRAKKGYVLIRVEGDE